MSDELKTAKIALVKLHQDMEAINRLAKPSYLSVVEQMERMLEPIRRQHLEISRASEMSGAMARIQEIANANQRRRELIKQASATNRIAESFAAAHQSWLERMKPLQPDFSRLSLLWASAKPALCDASLRLAATERLMAGVDFDAIKESFPGRDVGYRGAGELNSARGSLVWRLGRVFAGDIGHHAAACLRFAGALVRSTPPASRSRPFAPGMTGMRTRPKRKFSLSLKPSRRHRAASLFCSRSIQGLLGRASALGMPCMATILTGRDTFKARLGGCGTIFSGDGRPMISSPRGFRVCPIRMACCMRASQLVELGFFMFAGI